MHTNKRGAASFGTIVAIFGSILIALGIAWLIAQNWHQMHAALKIIILLAVTSAAYISGIMFRVRDYSGIGEALLILGALLFTLSVFLIAQIFATSVSWQGKSWLWFLAFGGVLLASYILQSNLSYTIAIAEYVIWVFTQTFAFFEKTGRLDASGGLILTVFFVISGILVGLIAAETWRLKRRELKSGGTI
ncbi:DUF2157 domain-containing protein [Candidatus Woesearchaeota archaeon]|nr:DUF2157 domain-containing protein [Candidatus Woesearchaeota archaeon]